MSTTPGNQSLTEDEPILIGGIWFRVFWVSKGIEEGAAKFGWCDLNNQSIYISNALSTSKVIDTFLHEVLHALYWFFSLDSKASEEEKVVSCLSSGINMVWINNPYWFNWYTNLLNDQKPTIKSTI